MSAPLIAMIFNEDGALNLEGLPRRDGEKTGAETWMNARHALAPAGAELFGHVDDALGGLAAALAAHGEGEDVGAGLGLAHVGQAPMTGNDSTRSR